MEAAVKVVKYFGRVDGENVIAVYIRTKENINNLKRLVGKDVTIAEKSGWIKYTKNRVRTKNTPKQGCNMCEIGNGDAA